MKSLPPNDKIRNHLVANPIQGKTQEGRVEFLIQENNDNREGILQKILEIW